MTSEEEMAELQKLSSEYNPDVVVLKPPYAPHADLPSDSHFREILLAIDGRPTP